MVFFLLHYNYRILASGEFPEPERPDKWLIPRARGRVLEVAGGSGKNKSPLKKGVKWVVSFS